MMRLQTLHRATAGWAVKPPPTCVCFISRTGSGQNRGANADPAANAGEHVSVTELAKTTSCHPLSVSSFLHPTEIPRSFPRQCWSIIITNVNCTGFMFHVNSYGEDDLWMVDWQMKRIRKLIKSREFTYILGQAKVEENKIYIYILIFLQITTPYIDRTIMSDNHLDLRSCSYAIAAQDHRYH